MTQNPHDPEPVFAAAWPTAQILPDGFLPMMATSATSPLESDQHAYEPKWEGYRVLVGFERQRVRVRSGTGQDALFWFPELAKLREAAQPLWVLLDGEVVVMQDGKVSAAGLQKRLRAADGETVERLAQELPITFAAYDILRIGDSWLMDVTWEERRDVLRRALRRSDRALISPAYATGAEALTRAGQLGLEAVVAKRLKGRYFPGDRTRDWLNLRPVEVVEAVIGGWTEGRGTRAGSIGTLLLGHWQNGELVYVGHTGTGLTAGTLRSLHQDLVRRARRTAPFRDPPDVKDSPRWVTPELSCRVRHQGWTETGIMRAPTFLEMVESPAVRNA